MTSTQAVLHAVAERLEAEPTVVLPALKMIAGIDALPREPAPLEATARALSAQRIAARRQEFRERSFDSGQVRRILGDVSRQAVSQRVANGSLLAAEVGGRWYFPDWQFDEDGVIPRLSEILAALLGGGSSPLAADALMRAVLVEESGASPAELLARGDADRALHYIGALRAGF